MTTLAEARRIYREAMAQYQERIPRRTALLGDGRGTAASNVLVPGRDDYVFARDDVNSTRFFQVLNQGAVQPAANLPVYIGFPLPGSSKTRDEEQVLGINYSGLGTIASGTIPPVGPHHQQHEFRGGDDILLDSRQFLTGLIHPTDPTTMTVQVESFIYFYNTWRRWEIGTSKDLTEYLPSSGYIRFVLIALDPEIGQLVYRPGVPFATGSQDIILGTFTPIPAPAGNELPLGYIRLLSTTTSIDWTSSADNIADARLWVNPPMLNVLDRIKQLEGLSGNPPNLAMTGAAEDRVEDIDKTINGLTDVDSTGVTDGQGLVFQTSTGRWIPGIAGGGVGGTGTATRIAYWDTSTAITSTANFTWDGSRIVLPGGVRLNGVGTGQLQMVNFALGVGAVAQLLSNSGSSDTATLAVVTIINQTTRTMAIFFTRGSSQATQEVVDPSGEYSITSGNANTTNIYWSAGNSRYEIENNTATINNYITSQYVYIV